ncbi:MAG: helix-turn-helix transcriptional regulator [Bacteroidia bacterium]|nr:helix-turn-helix transcriptional regulator [Bacteroidia bacterium]
MKIGIILKKRRNQVGIKQFELAERCNISQTYLSQIEQGKKEPHLSTLRIICEQLELPMPFVFFLAMEKNDLKEGKEKLFDEISPTLHSIIKEYLF